MTKIAKLQDIIRSSKNSRVLRRAVAVHSIEVGGKIESIWGEAPETETARRRAKLR